MDKKSLMEIKKTLKHGERCRIDRVASYYIEANGDIIANTTQSFYSLSEEDIELYSTLFMKSVSGKPGKHLYDVSFPTEEANPEENLLGKIVEGDLKAASKEHLDVLVEKIVASYATDERYVIMLAHASYSLAGKGHKSDDSDTPGHEFIVCCICPVKASKPALVFDGEKFVTKAAAWELKNPDAAFVYPAFEDRTTNIHKAWYYARKEDDRKLDMVEAIFGSSLPVSEAGQKQLFADVVEKSLGRDCTFDKVSAAAEELELMREQTAEDDGPCTIGKREMQKILKECGADADAMKRFDEAYDELIGESGSLSGDNVGAPKVEVRSEFVQMTIKPEAAAMLSSQKIDGRDFLLVPIQDDMTYNGIRLLNSRNEKAN